MSKDYTKYNVEGLDENLNKRQLVFTVVKDYVEKNNPSFEDLQKAFPDEVHGGNPDKFGLIRKEAEVKNHRYFNMREPLKIKQGVHVVVMNQWGDNIANFIAQAKVLGYSISSDGEAEAEDIIEKYTEYFKHQNYDNVLDFKFVTSELLNHFDWENESDCKKIEGLYDNLKEITFSNCPKYGGYLFLFTQIEGVDSDGDVYSAQDFDIYFNWDIAIENGYDWHDIIASGETVVYKVANEYCQDDFNNHFASLFVLTLLGSVDNAQSEEIAEFIVANNVEAYKKVFQDTVDEDFISDIVIDILKIIGYDIHDYEMDGRFCTIKGIHFLDAGLDMGYDYLRLAEDFRDSNI